MESSGGIILHSDDVVRCVEYVHIVVKRDRATVGDIVEYLGQKYGPLRKCAADPPARCLNLHGERRPLVGI